MTVSIEIRNHYIFFQLKCSCNLLINLDNIDDRKYVRAKKKSQPGKQNDYVMKFQKLLITYAYRGKGFAVAAPAIKSEKKIKTRDKK